MKRPTAVSTWPIDKRREKGDEKIRYWPFRHQLNGWWHGPAVIDFFDDCCGYVYGNSHHSYMVGKKKGESMEHLNLDFLVGFAFGYIYSYWRYRRLWM